MGSGLADNVSQGGAGPDQFRTAPLWGLGQRVFFLHEGSDPRTAADACHPAHSNPGSEANAVVAQFQKLSATATAGSVQFPAVALIPGWASLREIAERRLTRPFAYVNRKPKRSEQHKPVVQAGRNAIIQQIYATDRWDETRAV